MTVTSFRSAHRSVREDDRWGTPSVRTTLLPGGQITVEGPYHDDGTDTMLAITGGTGRYTGAEGSMLLHATGNPVGSEYDFIFTLSK